LATYFDKSFFPYNPNSDIGMYGKAFHMAQPDLPKDLADAYYTRSWQDTDNYGSFQHTRMFLGMLNKFFDRSQDEARYFKSLSSTEQYSERSRLPQRDGDYFWSSRQTTANKLGFLDESMNPSVYRGDLDEDGKIDGVILKNAFVKDDINNPINGEKSEEFWNELRTEGVINSDGSINNFNTDSDLGLSPENIEQYKDHILDILDKSSSGKSDSSYVVSQLIWSLVGRPGADGRHLHQIQRESIGRLIKNKKISGLDSVANDMLDLIKGNGINGDTGLLNLTESGIVSRLQADDFLDEELYGLAVLLSTSQHLFLQGRRNLFGWAKQGFNQWHSADSSASTDRTPTRQKILSKFNPQDQMVFDQHLSGAIDTDPLGAMLYDFSITIGESKTEYRQHAVILKDNSVDTMVFQSQQDPTSWVGVSREDKGFKWNYGTYSNSTWSPNKEAVTGLSELDQNSIERRLIALGPLQVFIKKIMEGAVRYMNSQPGNDLPTPPTAADWYDKSQSAIKTLGNAADNTADTVDDSYRQWLKSFPVATLYRALELFNGKSGTDFSTYQSVYTNESAGWENSSDPGILIKDNRRVFVDHGSFYRMNDVLSRQLTKDKQLFLNKGVAQSRANATYNERRRDKQAMKAAQWVRDYKAWRDEQDALLS
jgi:hypothetical protein